MLQKKSYFPYLIFLTLAIVAFYQVSFFIHPVKYDAIDCFYPWRFHIGECLQNGQLPYWNPYQDLGYPIHADPSSGAWYPMVWLIGFFGGYSIYSIGFEFWIHLFFAGVGFYTLSRTLKFEQNYALLAGMAYMLCGLFIGNAQHLPYIISAAWLPFVLNFYFRLVNEKTFINSLKAAFFLFLMITGGYPAFTIILFYLLLLFFVIYLVRKLKQRNKKELLHFIARHALFLFYTILLSLVLFVSIYQVSPYLSRLGDFELKQALFSPFSPQSFISFILPFATTTQTDFFNSDLSMRNAYFGLFLFLFFILGIFSKKPLEIKVLFYFGLFALTAAVGEYLPIREFLFKYVPMMNVFRFPSVFRLFFIIGAILTALVFLNKHFEEKTWNKKPLIIGSLSMVILFILLVILSRSKGYLSLGDFIKNNLLIASEQSTIWQNIAFQSIIQIAFLFVFLIVLWKIKDRQKIIASIVILTILDLFITSQLNAPYTVYSHQVHASETTKNTAHLRKGFPKVSAISIEEAGHLPGLGQPFWQNLNTFQKEFSAEGFNSFSFTSYEFLESEYPQLFSQMKKNNVLLLSDSIVSADELRTYKKDSLFTQKQLFFEPLAFMELKQMKVVHHLGDTSILLNYDAANFLIQTNVKHQQLLTLFQKQYTGWKASINGEEVPIFKSNLNFMTVVIPAGTSEIHFEYTNPSLKKAFFISALSFIWAILFFIFSSLKSLRNR